MKQAVIAGAMAVAMIGAGAAQAETGFGVGVKVGTLGMGAELTKSLTDNINGRIGFNTYDFSDSGTEGDIDYDIDLEWQSTALLLDWHPWGGSFRLTAGYIFNGNELKMKAKPSATYTVGNTTYAASDIASLTGNVTFSDGPYVGLGWSNAGKAGFGFSFELGAVYQGSPDLNLSGECTNVAVCATFDAELAREEAQAQADLDEFKWYPQVAVGVSYGF
ncbi:MAG: hypothetical protein AB1450_15170 [Pseudomonadota bacterium]